MVELAVSGVSVRFGGIQALADVDLHVTGGRVQGLIGPNGAGKTTLFNVLTGLQPPSAGTVRLDGRDVTRARPHVRARLGLARTFQRLEVFGTLTARENVRLAAEVQRGRLPAGTSPEAFADRLLAQVGIAAIADEPTDALPTGQARLVELARALASAPAVLLVDEPSSGLDRRETAAVGAVLAELAGAGMAVLLVEHDMGLVMDVCSHLDVLDAGQVIASGEPATVRADPAVQAAYLGGHPNPARRAAVPAGAAGRNGSDPPPARPMIELEDLVVAYGRMEAVHGVSLAVPEGGVCAMLGPNGAGKSTLLKVLSGRLAPAGGRATIDGVVLGRPCADKLVRRGVCAVPEGRSVFPNLTVAENLRMCTYRGRSVRWRQVEERAFERFPRLEERRRQLAGTLSGGEQQMLSMARALTTDPRVLLLDELSLGLAPLVVEELYGVVGELARREQLTVLVVEQFAEAALALATQACVLVNGRIVDHGPPAEVEARLADSYLGLAT